jgi:hypothetical protein
VGCGERNSTVVTDFLGSCRWQLGIMQSRPTKHLSPKCTLAKEISLSSRGCLEGRLARPEPRSEHAIARQAWSPRI